MNELHSFSDVINEIVKFKGVEVLKNDRLFMAMFSDLAPNMTIENKIIKRICSENSLSRFYNIVVSGASEKNSVINTVVIFLKDELGFSDDWIRKVILAFCDAFSISYNYPEKDCTKKNDTITIAKSDLSDSKISLSTKVVSAETNKVGTVNSTVDLQNKNNQKKRTGRYFIIGGLLALSLIIWYFFSKNKEYDQGKSAPIISGQIIENKDNSDQYYDTNMDNVSTADVQYWGIITSTYSEGIAIHPEPKKDSAVLGRISYQEVFPIYFVESGTTYGYTSYNGIVGYINLDYAEIYDSDIDNEVDLIDYGIYKDGHGISAYEYVLPDSDSRYLTRDDVANLTLRGVNYAKNEIYARHGRDFNSKELREFFAGRYWYSVSYSLSDENDRKITSMFNAYERENSAFLDLIEKEMGTYNLQ